MATITIFGRLGADPTPATRKDGSPITTKNGGSIYNLSIAEPNSRDRELTNWHQCTIFGAQGDLLARSAMKGDRLLIEGQQDFETYTDKDGNPRMGVKTTISRFTFVEAKRDANPPVDSAPKYQEASNF